MHRNARLSIKLFIVRERQQSALPCSVSTARYSPKIHDSFFLFFRKSCHTRGHLILGLVAVNNEMYFEIYNNNSFTFYTVINIVKFIVEFVRSIWFSFSLHAKIEERCNPVLEQKIR